jgi:hypothetical protein
MPTLADALLAEGRREKTIARVVADLEAHVARLSGLRGIALRAGLAAIKAVRPDALPLSVSRLLPPCVAAMEPLYQKARAEGTKFNVFLARHTDEATETLMAVIDARAESSQHQALRALHRRLRGSIESEMRDALPDFAAALSTVD